MTFIVVLGMHRSGTSATAGFLSLLNFFPGHNLFPPNRFNPKGYFENKSIVFENDRLLSVLGLYGWSDPQKIDLDFSKEITSKLKLADIDNFLKAYNHQSYKILKDPRLCRLLPSWKQVFLELGEIPQYLITLRDPADVLASLARRDGMHPNHSALLYAVYLIDAERHSRGEPRALVRYKDLLNNTLDVVNDLDNRIGTSFTSSAPELLSEALAFLDPELDHKSNDQSVSNSAFIDFAYEVYDAFDRHFYDVSSVVFDQLQIKLDRLRAMLEPWALQAARLEALRAEIFAPKQTLYEIASENAFAKVYWKTTSHNYLESHSLSLPFKFSNNENSLKFILPSVLDRFIGLRLDLTDKPSFCVASHIALIDDSGATRWIASGVESFANISDDLHIVSVENASNSILFISTGFDAYAELTVPDSVLAEVREGWIFSIAVKIQLLNDGVNNLVNLFKSADQRQTNLQKELHASMSFNASLNKNLSAKQVELDSCLRNQEVLRTELLRAEAQLTLLRELMVKDGDFESL